MKNNKQSRKQPWNAKEVAYLTKFRDSLTSREMAGWLRRSIKSVEQKLAHLPNPNPKQKPNPKIPLNEPLAGFWKREAITAQRKITTQDHDRTAVDVLVDKAVSLAPIAYVPPKLARPLKKVWSVSSPQPAVLMLSDTHVGALVTPDQTLGLGCYNFEIFLRRLARLERSVGSIIHDQVSTDVPEIVVAMLGDMIDGALPHNAEIGQTETLFTQFFQAGHAIAQFLRNLSVIAPIRVETTCGNHPRWASQKRMPTKDRFSNLDFFVYNYVAALLRDCPRVKLNLTKQPYAEFSVAGYSFLASHGDELRGGDKALGIPNHAVGRRLSNTSQNFNAAHKTIPNYYLYGHLHRSITLPHAGGEVLVNGGFVGTDGYTLDAGFNASAPSQRFFLMHPKFGKAASYDIQLAHGDDTPHGYDIPEI